MDIDSLAEAIGYLFALLGTLVLGIATGIGLATWLTARRFACRMTVPGGVGDPAALVNVSAACADVLGATRPMILVGTAGGLVAFVAGVVAIVYGRRA